MQSIKSKVKTKKNLKKKKQLKCVDHLINIDKYWYMFYYALWTYR